MGMYPGLCAVLLLLFQAVGYSGSYVHWGDYLTNQGLYSPEKRKKGGVAKTREHDLMQPEYELRYKNDIYVTVRIYDSDCFSAATESPFVIYLGALNFENELTSWYALNSTEGVTADEPGMKELTRVISHYDPEACFAQGGEPCVPRADVIFIYYLNDPEDTWSLSHVEVDVQFRLWPGMENWYMTKYEHSVLLPCDSWMDTKAFYQIGPRIGLFAKLDAVPLRGKWSKLELPAWLAVAVIVVSVPALAFTAFKVFTLFLATIEERRRRKTVREDVETVKAPRRPSQHVVSIATVEGKERFDMSRRPTIPGQPPKPPMTNKVSSISLPGTKQASVEAAEPTPKISGCCLDEERLLGLGKMPFDISVVEEEQQKELEKLKRAPESPPVAKILNAHQNHQANTPSPSVTPQPSRQST